MKTDYKSAPFAIAAAVCCAVAVLVALHAAPQPLGAQAAPAVAAPAPTVSTLKYSSAPAFKTDNAIVACCFADAIQAVNLSPVPLSHRYLTIKAGQASRKDDITVAHGWSNPILGWQLAHTYGSCAESKCGPFAMSASKAMDADAAQYRVGATFVTHADIPTYPAAVKWLVANPRSAVVITSAGRAGYAIVGVENNLGVWVDHNGRVGLPRVWQPTDAEGVALWDRMVMSGLPELSEANFVVGFVAR